MSDLIRNLNTNIDLSSGQKVLSAGEYTDKRKAKKIVDLAIEKAKQLEASAVKAYELQEDMGYEEGLKRGKKQSLNLMLQNSERAIESLNKLEDSIAQLIVSSVEYVVGELDDYSVIYSVLKKLLDTIIEEQGVTIKANPRITQTVKNALEDYTDAFSNYRIVPDDMLEGRTIVIETPTGIIEGSVEEQLVLFKEAVLSI